ncbi:CpeS-like protein [Rubidibacter lacunae KORDI 51-2]|uniref:Chromophore lyase CpcS/CpeS n=1 Tax=Rubidibacter lacunae KORDI 51-2 TaxID=582515 RepID=U5DQH8_9CHRO|nr:phycobiliprotein lyase [Rubidibacter lacunae]ERN41945.1 CpeS-like protein [Rubidibacter lacunae KORDI 51-2]
MQIAEFVEQSLGRWRSQRSGHNLAFQHFEEVRSTIDISARSNDDAEVLKLCQLHDVEPDSIASPFHMEWEGESDWDEDESPRGNCLLVPIPNSHDPSRGLLLRSQGYAETIPSVGRYVFTEEGMFVLATEYDRAAAEERIWFATENLRFRVSTIKTSNGTGILTASFASEVRSLSG